MKEFIVNDLNDINYSKIITLLDYETRISDYLKSIKISSLRDVELLIDTGLCSGINKYRFISVHVNEAGDIDLNAYKFVTVPTQIIELANKIISTQKIYVDRSILTSKQKAYFKSIS